MNVNIIKCSNGYIVNKYNHDFNGIILNNSNMNHMEQFVFLTLEEAFTWIRLNYVTEQLKK